MKTWWIDTPVFRGTRRLFIEKGATPEQAEQATFAAIRQRWKDPLMQRQMLDYALGQVRIFVQGCREWAKDAPPAHAAVIAAAEAAVRDRAQGNDPDAIMEEIGTQSVRLFAFRPRTDA